jgi:hypothetical protein
MRVETTIYTRRSVSYRNTWCGLFSSIRDGSSWSYGRALYRVVFRLSETVVAGVMVERYVVVVFSSIRRRIYKLTPHKP